MSDFLGLSCLLCDPPARLILPCAGPSGGNSGGNCKPVAPSPGSASATPTGSIAAPVLARPGDSLDDFDPQAGRACSSRSSYGIAAGSGASISRPMPHSPCQASASTWRLSTSNTRSVFKHRSDVGNVGSHPPFRTWAFQPVQKAATIHVSSGFIWGIPAKLIDRYGERIL